MLAMRAAGVRFGHLNCSRLTGFESPDPQFWVDHGYAVVQGDTRGTTLVVSLEAIFLSTFVMIGQNRQAAFQQAKADHDFEAQELELKTNTDLTRQIHVLTAELHRRLIGGSA
jgi:hypothetical protein